MRYALLILFSLPIAVCLLPALILAVDDVRPPFLHVMNFNRVEKGMTLQEVEKLLGGPPGKYNGATGHGSMTLEGYQPANSASEQVWLDKSHYFTVHFDADGLVVGSHKQFDYSEEAQIAEGFFPRTWRKFRLALGF